MVVYVHLFKELGSYVIDPRALWFSVMRPLTGVKHGEIKLIECIYITKLIHLIRLYC
jgi:hypothetical protein